MDDDKISQIQQWLEKLLPGDELPSYEINSHTVDILYTMAKQSEKKDTLAKIAIEDMEQKTEEYVAETNRLKSVSDWLGLNTSDLSPTARGHVKSLASIAVALNLKECSDTSLCLSLSDLCRKRANDEVKRTEMMLEVDTLQENLRKLLLKQADQKRILGEVAQELTSSQVTNVAKQVKETEFLKQKTKQYHSLVTSMKDELKEMGYEPSISHGSLQAIAMGIIIDIIQKEIEKLRSQLSPLQAQLASYQDLPPDLDLAKIKVHETRCHLVRLEEAVSRTVDLVHTEK